MTARAVYCIRCDAPYGRCRHDAGSYEDERFARLMQLEPVETTAGDVVRRMAMRALANRYVVLLERSKTYDFAEIERQHMIALEYELERLQRMAPVGELQPPRGDLDLEGVATQ